MANHINSKEFFSVFSSKVGYLKYIVCAIKKTDDSKIFIVGLAIFILGADINSFFLLSMSAPKKLFNVLK